MIDIKQNSIQINSIESIPNKELHNDNIKTINNVQQININSEKENDDVIKKSIDFLNSLHLTNIKFDFDNEMNVSLVKIIDEESNRVIRQFPTKEFLKRLKFFKEEILPGLLLDKKA